MMRRRKDSWNPGNRRQSGWKAILEHGPRLTNLRGDGFALLTEPCLCGSSGLAQCCLLPFGDFLLTGPPAGTLPSFPHGGSSSSMLHLQFKRHLFREISLNTLLKWHRHHIPRLSNLIISFCFCFALIFKFCSFFISLETESLLCSPGLPGTQYVNPPISTSQELELKVCVTMPRHCLYALRWVSWSPG